MTETEKWINESLINLPRLCAEIRRLSEANDILHAQQEENKLSAFLAQYAAQKFQESMTDFKEIQRLKTQLAALGNMEKNDPLTLDELRNMDGDPVWVTPGNFWALVRVVDKLVILVASDGERAYAGAWIKLMGPIYRRKPEEGAEIGVVGKDKDVPTKLPRTQRRTDHA